MRGPGRLFNQDAVRTAYETYSWANCNALQKIEEIPFIKFYKEWDDKFVFTTLFHYVLAIAWNEMSPQLVNCKFDTMFSSK